MPLNKYCITDGQAETFVILRNIYARDTEARLTGRAGALKRRR